LNMRLAFFSLPDAVNLLRARGEVMPTSSTKLEPALVSIIGLAKSVIDIVKVIAGNRAKWLQPVRLQFLQRQVCSFGWGNSPRMQRIKPVVLCKEAGRKKSVAACRQVGGPSPLVR